MHCSLKMGELKEYIGCQLEQFMPDKYKFTGNDIDTALRDALDRVEYCFKHIGQRHYWHDGQVIFSHLHGDQYATFLYFLSNSLWRISENRAICDKLIYLNRILNSFFFSYKAQLPKIFRFQHPIGSIIGNAEYEDFLVILQNVTINTGDGRGGAAPHIGKGVFLAVGATILGNTQIGDGASVSANITLFDEIIPPNHIVLLKDGRDKMVRPRGNKTCMAQQYFKTSIFN